MPLSKHTKEQFRLEADFHANVARVLKQPKFIAVLDEIHDTPALEKEAEADPRKYLEARGVKLPTDASWEITAYAGNFSFRFCIFSWCWRITITRD